MIRRVYSLSLSQDEHRMLAQIAQHLERDRADALRFIIRTLASQLDKGKREQSDSLHTGDINCDRQSN